MNEVRRARKKAIPRNAWKNIHATRYKKYKDYIKKNLRQTKIHYLMKHQSAEAELFVSQQITEESLCLGGKYMKVYKHIE